MARWPKAQIAWILAIYSNNTLVEVVDIFWGFGVQVWWRIFLTWEDNLCIKIEPERLKINLKVRSRATSRKLQLIWGLWCSPHILQTYILYIAARGRRSSTLHILGSIEPARFSGWTWDKKKEGKKAFYPALERSGGVGRTTKYINRYPIIRSGVKSTHLVNHLH